jgi:5-methyltetrahydrofolate--homocysteine methyltransferase
LQKDGNAYEPGVFYCKDAFEGLDTMDSLIDPKRKPAMLEQLRKDADMEMNRASQTPEQSRTEGHARTLSLHRLHCPPNLGQRIVKDMPLEMVLKHLNINELYRLSWGAKNTHGAEWDKIKADFDARLAKMTKEALKDGWLKPQAVYGYFPCQADGDDLIIYETADQTKKRSCASTSRASLTTIISRFQITTPAVESGQMDVVALCKSSPLVSKPPKNLRKCKPPMITPKPTSPMDSLCKLPKRRRIICTNTSAASWDLAKSRASATRGATRHPRTRRSFQGLPIITRCRIRTRYESCHFRDNSIPEQSTAAIIVHHKDAKYYSVGESRVEQLMK